MWNHEESPTPRRLGLLVVGALTLVLASTSGAVGQPEPDTASSGAGSARTAGDTSVSRCEGLTATTLPGIAIDSATVNSTGSADSEGGPQITGLPEFCDVRASQHDRAGNEMHVRIWLPTRTWNKRFQAVGGGGFACGLNYRSLLSAGAALKNGYSTASADCGVSKDARDGSFALGEDGSIDESVVEAFAHLGIHKMTVGAKAVTTAYYDRAPSYSYFNGCSTGGRQAMMEAQRYPTDYDGILAGAPAVNWTSFVTAEMWPQLVMNEAGNFMPECKGEAFSRAVVKACDPLDGVTDEVIGNYADCRWSPAALVGHKTPCGPITKEDAAVMAEIWKGPHDSSGERLWHGLTPGTSLFGDYYRGFGWSGIGATTSEGGVADGLPFPISMSWYKHWLLRDPDWDWHTLDRESFEELFQRSREEFSDVMATDDPDLSEFRESGGKLLIWHGMVDDEIFPQGTIDYYERVVETMGAARGQDGVDSFARLFLAPGVAHCGGGAGPQPKDPFGDLVAWVEDDAAPESVLASKTDPETNIETQTRPLCKYPLVAKYTGRGSTDDAQNFVCAPTYASANGKLQSN